MSKTAYQKVPSRASPKNFDPALPWPPSEKGERIRVVRSPVATYYIGFGLSRWFPLDHQSWIWLRPERWREGRAFPESCGQLQQVRVFRGLTPDVRVQVQAVFDGVVVNLRALAAREAGAP